MSKYADPSHDPIAKAREALEPFADVVGEGIEDFADDAQAVVQVGRKTYYALTLGDFRRALAVLTLLGDQP